MAKKSKGIDGQLEEIIEEQEEKLKIPDDIPVLMLRDIVVFPYMVIPYL